MNELIEKVDNLKEALEKTEEVKAIKEMNQKVSEEKELLEEIERYQRTPSEELKEKIIKNPIFREYKKKETDCNILIMEINQRLKEISKKGKSCHENH